MHTSGKFVVVFWFALVSGLVTLATSSSAGGSVVEFVGGEDIDTKLHTGEWFVEVYAQWCGFCQKFAPTYEAVANRLKGKVNVAKIDGDEHPDVSIRFHVTGFPTMFYIRDGEVRLYTGQRTEDALVAFAGGKWKEVEPMPFYTSPLTFMGKVLAVTAGYVLQGIVRPIEFSTHLYQRMYNVLNQDYEIPHAALVIGVAVAILVFSFVLVEAGSWITFTVLWMFMGNSEPQGVKQPKANPKNKSPVQQQKQPAPKEQPAKETQDTKEKVQKRKAKPKKDQ